MNELPEKLESPLVIAQIKLAQQQLAEHQIVIEQLVKACKRANGRLLELGGERNSPATLQIINVALATADKLERKKGNHKCRPIG